MTEQLESAVSTLVTFHSRLSLRPLSPNSLHFGRIRFLTFGTTASCCSSRRHASRILRLSRDSQRQVSPSISEYPPRDSTFSVHRPSKVSFTSLSSKLGELVTELHSRLTVLLSLATQPDILLSLLRVSQPLSPSFAIYLKEQLLILY